MVQKIVPIRQGEQSECGLACLVMIANFWGHSLDLVGTRQRFSTTLRGVALPQLIAMASQLQLTARAVRLEVSALKRLQLPAILHWEFNHYVVLESVNASGVMICDPARGRIKANYTEFSRRFTGVAIELSPAKDFAPLKDKGRLPISAILGRAKGVFLRIPALFASIATAELAALTLPVILKAIIDASNIASPLQLRTLIYLSAAYVGVIFVGAMLALLRSALIISVSNRLLISGAGSVFWHLLRLPYTFFQNRHPSDVFSRLESLAAIPRILSARAFDTTIDGVLAIAIVFALSFYDMRISAIVLGAGLAIVAMQILAAPYIQLRTTDALNAAVRQASEIQESLRGIQTIQVYGIQHLRQMRMLNSVVETAGARAREQLAAMALSVSQKALLGLALLAIVLIAVQKIGVSGWTVGLLIMIISYATQALTRVERLAAVFEDFRLATLHKDRLSDVLLSPIDSGEGEQTLDLDAPVSIEVRDLWFRHSKQDPWVLRSLNMHIHAGESVAIVGPSGCGKSTLVKILLGLLEPTKGEILINGVPLASIGKVQFRKTCASVLQDDRLFFGSIAQNITLFDLAPTDEKMVSAAAAAGIRGEIERMPMKYHTLVGGGHPGLSGGQSQRVLLARALYANPKVLMLDEATSHLDTASESTINESIKQLRITRLIVAHRQETIRSADRVVDLSFANNDTKPAEAALE